MIASRVRAPLLAAAASLAILAAACSAPAEARSRTVEIGIRYSRFRPATMTVPAGTTVGFVVRNHDPIDHELIVGDESVQARHESGTEAHHGEVPGEVSVPAGKTATTTYTFARPGTYLIGCHLPGHYAYGMRGTVTVTG